MRIEHILETHNHADHVSGHGRLAAATGATIHVHRDAAPDYDHEPFDDGWELQLGALTVRALHTPGHRPEHTAFALIDTERSEEPWAVLTGDSLFVGDIARPDLAVDKDEGAHGIFHSLHGKLLALPDTTEVWPGHLGGSLCGGPGMDLKVSSTIGFERANQPLLQIERRGRLRAPDDRGAGAAAAELPNIVALNRGPLAVDDASTCIRSRPRQVEQARRTARWSSTCAPSCSSTRRTSPARCRSPRAAAASAPGSRGWRPRASRSCWWAATTRTRREAAELAGAVGLPTSPATSPAA